MNIIAEKIKSIRFYTSLRDVENWLEIKLSDYDWHVADIHGGWQEMEDPCWISGDKIRKKIDEFDWQFIWAVFSAYPKGTKAFHSEIPYADGNPNFWSGSPVKQLEGSLFEIVCWDSSATLFIGMPDNLGRNLLRNAIGALDLDKFNKRRDS
jgi:hypothetical protein